MAQTEFDAVLGSRPNQIERQVDQKVSAAELLDPTIPGATVTGEGLRTNINVGIRYLAAWLEGNGAAAIDNLMEDVATAEISRSQIWQWVHHGVGIPDLGPITSELVTAIADEETSRLQLPVEARDLFLEVALSPDFIEFLTLSAYEHIN